jgi:flagellar basal-body rod protein FlgB
LALNDLPLIGFLKSKMAWHQSRQRVLAENVANADTPGYRARDLKPMQFRQHLESRAVSTISTARTHNAHLSGGQPSGGNGAVTEKSDGWEITPEGNAVVLEEQMIKVAGNQFDFQLASTLYSRSLGLLRTAIGRNS